MLQTPARFFCTFSPLLLLPILACSPVVIVHDTNIESSCFFRIEPFVPLDEFRKPFFGCKERVVTATLRLERDGGAVAMF